MKKLIYIFTVAILSSSLQAQVNFKELLPDSIPNLIPQKEKKTLVYVFNIKENIAAPIWRTTKLAFENAKEANADIVLIDMNTYGGEVSAADSIRTHILNAQIPVYVFINDNAASAGALISIACDSIYMKPSAKIGAATVVNQSGEQVPDKYQSYMRGTMRATAEAHGKDTVIINGDTTIVWKRNPAIAEAMVDPKLSVKGVSDSGQVLTFTASEAMANGYCEATYNSRKELLDNIIIEEYIIEEYNPSGLDKLIGLLINPFVTGILIMIIVGGIYFELQSPGIGFPLIASIIASLLYFAPLYLEGLAEYWELIIFIVGVILIIVELFAIPGFGVAGIAGVIAMILGLSLSLIDNEILKDVEMNGEGFNLLMKAFGVVILSSFLGLSLSIWAANRLLTSYTFSNLALHTEQNTNEGYIGVDKNELSVIGKIGIAHTVLRPSGKIIVDDKILDAKSEYGFIEKGEEIKVLRNEAGQVYVTKIG